MGAVGTGGDCRPSATVQQGTSIPQGHTQRQSGLAVPGGALKRRGLPPKVKQTQGLSAPAAPEPAVGLVKPPLPRETVSSGRGLSSAPASILSAFPREATSFAV